MKKRIESRLGDLENKNGSGKKPLITLIQVMGDPDHYRVGPTVVGRFSGAKRISEGGEVITAKQAETYSQDHPELDVIIARYVQDWRGGDSPE